MKKAPQSERTRIPKRTADIPTVGSAGRRKLEQAKPHRKIYDAARKAQVCAYHLYSINHGGTHGCIKGGKCEFRHHLPTGLVVPYGPSGKYVVFRIAENLVGQAARGPDYKQTMIPSENMDFAQWASRIEPMADDAKLYRDYQNIMKRQAHQKGASKKRKVGTAAKPRAITVEPIEVGEDSDATQFMVGSPKPATRTPRGKTEVEYEPVEQKLDRSQPPRNYPVALPGRSKYFHSNRQWLVLLKEQEAHLQAQREAVERRAEEEEPILDSAYTARCLRFEHLMLKEPLCGPGTAAYQLRYETVPPHSLGRLHQSLTKTARNVTDAHLTLHLALERAMDGLKQLSCFFCKRVLQRGIDRPATKACHTCYAAVYCDDSCRSKDTSRHAFGCYPHPGYLMHYEQVAHGIDHEHPHQPYLMGSSEVDVNCEEYAGNIPPAVHDSPVYGDAVGVQVKETSRPTLTKSSGMSSSSGTCLGFEKQGVAMATNPDEEIVGFEPSGFYHEGAYEYTATSPSNEQLLAENVALEQQLEYSHAETSRLVKELAEAKAQLKIKQVQAATTEAVAKAPPVEAATEEKAEAIALEKDEPSEKAKDPPTEGTKE
jgi:hypothetical protein